MGIESKVAPGVQQWVDNVFVPAMLRKYMTTDLKFRDNSGDRMDPIESQVSLSEEVQ